MAEVNPTRVELSKAVNKAIRPFFLEKGFKVQDGADKDFAFQYWLLLGDGVYRDRFIRTSPLGYDTFELSFTKFTDQESGNEFIGVGVEFGIHIQAIEQLQTKLNIALNPFRLGKLLPDIWKIKPNLMQVKSMNDIAIAKQFILEIAQLECLPFWQNHQTLADIPKHFETWSIEERHSPKGGSHVTRYLMIVALLTRDYEFFERIIVEYKPHVNYGIYGEAFDELVETINAEFVKLGDELP